MKIVIAILFFISFSSKSVANSFDTKIVIDTCDVKKSFSKKQLDEAIAQIKRNSFENNKLLDVKKIIASNCLDTNQIIILATIFHQEERRLEIVKFGYNHCKDVVSYPKIKGIFGNKKVKKDFEIFLKSKTTN